MEVQVCVDDSGASSIVIVCSLLFAAEGEDYVFSSEEWWKYRGFKHNQHDWKSISASSIVTFTSNDTVNGTVQCVQINITDDDAYEEDEHFSIRIAAARPTSAVSVGTPSEINKTIQDNTGKNKERDYVIDMILTVCQCEITATHPCRCLCGICRSCVLCS